jgi:metal-dependent amidase/aminoacylase/carboxypeptidase family protein
VADILVKVRGELKGNAVLFQPAEEVPEGEEGGAALMLKQGCSTDIIRRRRSGCM